MYIMSCARRKALAPFERVPGHSFEDAGSVLRAIRGSGHTTEDVGAAVVPAVVVAVSADGRQVDRRALVHRAALTRVRADDDGVVVLGAVDVADLETALLKRLLDVLEGLALDVRDLG